MSRRFPNVNMAGPPPNNHSKLASMLAEQDGQKEQEHENRSTRFGRSGDVRNTPHETNPTNNHSRFTPQEKNPPPNNNSRFAFAAAHAQREQEPMERTNRGSRFGRASGDVRNTEKSVRFENDHYGGDRDHYGGGGRHGDYNRGNRELRGGSNRPGLNRPSIFSHDYDKTVFIAPKLPDHLHKKKPKPILPKVQVPLALPGEDEEEARARIERMERRKKENEETRLAEEKETQLENQRKMEEEPCTEENSVRAADVEVELVKMFGDGSIIGTELVQWCVDQKSLLPSVEKLVWSVLEQWNEGESTPDLDCPWAKPENFGAAMLSLVEDHVSRQVQILWGIQKYCQVREFPKINNEYLVQAMFRAMYKYDLASLEAFVEWKEDDSEEHSEGKMKAIIQTVDWFNWLEEEDEDEEEYEEKEYDDTYDVDGEMYV